MPVAVRVPVKAFSEAVSNLTEGKERYYSLVEEDEKTVQLPLVENHKPLLTELLNFGLTKPIRTRISQFLFRKTFEEANSLKERLNTKPESFNTCLHIIEEVQDLPFQLRIMGRWYEFSMPKVDLIKDRSRIIGLHLGIVFKMVRSTYSKSIIIDKSDFVEYYGDMTMAQIFKSLDVRRYLTPKDPSQSPAQLIVTSIGMAEDYALQITTRGQILEIKTDKTESYHSADMQWQVTRNIYEAERAVIEPELELPRERHHRYRHNVETTHGILPFVRGFSLRTRTYFFTDVRNVEIYQYRTDVANKLVLNPKHRAALQTIFSADVATIKDLIPGKTGGLCILAWGNSGTGKTITAEIYAETKERVLYPLSVSEIGTTPEEIEENLQRVFTRVERWNAVLLFDECDIFLSKRSGDIDQAAIVGMFLRLMDYYTGTLFLTTNRLHTIDDAIDSRLALRIHYQDLQEPDRAQIWKGLLGEANIVCKPDVLADIAKHKLDGRKIRNFVRLMQLHKIEELTTKQFEDLLEFIVLPVKEEKK